MIMVRVAGIQLSHPSSLAQNCNARLISYASKSANHEMIENRIRGSQPWRSNSRSSIRMSYLQRVRNLSRNATLGISSAEAIQEIPSCPHKLYHGCAVHWGRPTGSQCGVFRVGLVRALCSHYSAAIHNLSFFVNEIHHLTNQFLLITLQPWVDLIICRAVIGTPFQADGQEKYEPVIEDWIDDLLGWQGSSECSPKWESQDFIMESRIQLWLL